MFITHSEYPRPGMVRDSYLNLNGTWEYAILSKEIAFPDCFHGHIVVPFPVESQLSQVGKVVGIDNQLWYKRKFVLPEDFQKEITLLHFGGVDWEMEVFINGVSAGFHQGGFDAFSFDISNFLLDSEEQEIMIRVWDPTDLGPQPRGKQVENPGGIWYSSVTGIWQTVWLENVAQVHISKIKVSTDWENKAFIIELAIENAHPEISFTTYVYEDGILVSKGTGALGNSSILQIDNPRFWSPEEPYLYDIEVALHISGQIVDQIKSYSGMRKISLKKDSNGFEKLALNDEIKFHYGPLDQGWWPEGLYTPPNDEAIIFDLMKVKEMGFNMVRKHVKVESQRWYYHCDRLGIMVWQDIPNGDNGNRWEEKPGVLGKGLERERTILSEEIYRQELKAMIDQLVNHPCVVVWIPFNEAWGQFKTKEISSWIKAYDSSRLVNGASGGNYSFTGQKIAGDIMDLHNYPNPALPDPQIFGQGQAIVLGEFGGLGLAINGHLWQSFNNWGYQNFSNEEDLMNRYRVIIEDLADLIPQGLAAAVYTQLADVEVEINGLMTYDRKIIKIPVSYLAELHQNLLFKNECSISLEK